MKKITVRTWQSLTIGLIVIGVLILSISGMLNQIIGSAVDPIVAVQGWFSTRVQAVIEFFTIPRDVTSLRQQNAALNNQISQLQSQVLQLNQQLSDTEILYALLDFARSKPENKYVAASVIGRDPSPFMNYIIIDHGSDNGIYKGMPVVTQQGLVGRISAVTATAARVQLISDAGSVVNVTVQGSTTEGQIIGSVTGDLTLEKVSTSSEIASGDFAITSGLGGTFPSEIMVGQILDISETQNGLFQTATIQPMVDFVSLKAVLIITNFESIDISPLIETQIP
jgi:rod shape-determining protein MreC